MGNRVTNFTRQALFCAIASLGLCAESPKLGFQVSGTVPTGSMRSDFTKSTGYGVGVFADWELDPGKTLRLAYDGVLYPNSHDSQLLPGMTSGSITNTSNDRKFRSQSLSLQYLYFPSMDNEGLYFMAGLGAMNLTQKIDAEVSLTDRSLMNLNTTLESGTKLACMAGVGYEFNKNWGVNARYNFITVNNHTLGAVHAGVSYRF